MNKEDVTFYTHTHTHTLEYYTAIRKNEILPSATTWMVLGDIMLSEISLIEKDRYHVIHLYVELKKIQN